MVGETGFYETNTYGKDR
nr:hypothetical protein [Sicyoidochytrium minutum DNA virus]